MPDKRHDIRIREADFDDADDRATVRRLVEAFADVSDVELSSTVREAKSSWPFVNATVGMRAANRCWNLPGAGHACDGGARRADATRLWRARMRVRCGAAQPPNRAGQGATPHPLVGGWVR